MTRTFRVIRTNDLRIIISRNTTRVGFRGRHVNLASGFKLLIQLIEWTVQDGEGVRLILILDFIGLRIVICLIV